MSSRRAPDSDPSQESRFEKAGAFVRRRALTGTEASTIGFVLVGYIGAFSFLGYWLDSLFKTSWMVAVGVLLGAIIGFREMFRMAQKLGRKSIADDTEKSREQLARGAPSEIHSAPEKPATPIENAPPEKNFEKRRIFSVPAPPTASFEKSDLDKLNSASQAGSTPVPSADDLYEELLNESDDEDETQI